MAAGGAARRDPAMGSARIVNAELGLAVTVSWDRAGLPRLWQWIHPRAGVYALGLEPANCSVLGRAADRAAGRLPVLAPGEERVTRVRIRGRPVLIAGPNLTIDRTLTGGELRPGEVLRFAAAAGPGGKGLNVARGAQALGAPPTLVAFLPGHTGTAVGAMIADEGIRLLGVPCGGEVRSTAVILEPGRSTVINEHGTEIVPADWARYEERVAGELSRHAVLVCSGSLPPGAPADAYARLAARAREHGVRCLVDAAGPAVRRRARGRARTS